MFVHLAACRADAELRAVGFDLFVQDVVSCDLLLQVCHGGAVLLRVHLFLRADTGRIQWMVCKDKMTTTGQV